VTCYTEGFSHFVTSMTAPVASGWSDLAGWGLHPLESAALSRRTRIADVADRGLGRLNWAESALTGVAFGSGGLDLEERVRPKFEPRALIAQVECND
jgi:hypothetical protein